MLEQLDKVSRELGHVSKELGEFREDSSTQQGRVATQMGSILEAVAAALPEGRRPIVLKTLFNLAEALSLPLTMENMHQLAAELLKVR